MCFRFNILSIVYFNCGVDFALLKFPMKYTLYCMIINTVSEFLYIDLIPLYTFQRRHVTNNSVIESECDGNMSLVQIDWRLMKRQDRKKHFSAIVYKITERFIHFISLILFRLTLSGYICVNSDFIHINAIWFRLLV